MKRPDLRLALAVDSRLTGIERNPRANVSTGSRMQPVNINDTQRDVVKAMHDKLVHDRMFFVGVDVIGDKVIEINTESPGGLQALERLYEVDVCPVVIDALERRTRNGACTPTADS